VLLPNVPTVVPVNTPTPPLMTFANLGICPADSAILFN